jgi:hypothetical protein
MTATFGAIAAFFVVIVTILQLSKIRDKTFADYAEEQMSRGAIASKVRRILHPLRSSLFRDDSGS